MTPFAHITEKTLFGEMPVSLPTRKPKQRSPKKNVVKVNHIVAQSRYYYHRKLKDVVLIDAALRTMEIPYNCFEDIPKPYRYYVGQLIKMGYTHQFKLLQVCPTIKQS